LRSYRRTSINIRGILQISGDLRAFVSTIWNTILIGIDDRTVGIHIDRLHRYIGMKRREEHDTDQKKKKKFREMFGHRDISYRVHF
jgi:hypothetical protein